MDLLLQDLKYSLRTLRQSPGFTAVAWMALAIGIGANTAIFSVVNTVLLRPLPYPHPERIVQVLGNGPWGTYPYTSVPRFNAYRAQSRIFENVTAFDWRGSSAMNLTAGGQPEPVRGEQVSHEFFRLFGVPFVAGRAFTPEEDSPGGDRVAVISAGLWQRRFGGDAHLIGKSILLGGDPYTVVGIVSPAFAPDPPVDLWVPLQANPDSINHATFLYVAARLRPGVTLEQANAALQLAAAEFRRKFPEGLGKNGSFSVESLQRSITGDVRPALFVLLGAVACLLCIACANVAGLLLARGTARAREMAIRVAIGAGRTRIVRQLLTEAAVLCTAGGSLGLLVGSVGVRALVKLYPGDLAVTLDGRVLLFTVVVSLATVVLCGLIPALHASRVDPDAALRDGGARTGGRRQNRTRSAIIVAEMALAFVLLTGAGLLLRTLVALRGVVPGFDTHNVLTLESPLNGARFERTGAIASAVRACEQHIAGIPGVEAVAAASSVPLESNTGMAFRIAGRPTGERPFHGQGWWRYVTWGYFDVHRIPIVRGRAFTARDDAAGPPVVLISATMARQYWPGSNPIGQRIRLDSGDPASTEPYREIVGVVADVRELGLREEGGNATYVPLPQVTDDTMAVVRRIGPLTWTIRTRVAPLSVAADVRREIRIAAGLPADRVRSMDQVISRSTERERFHAILLAIFAGIAILLAAIGLYGVISYAMAQRTREFGVRLALGAGAAHLRNMIVRQAMTLALTGIVVGCAASLALTRLMESILYGVRPNDVLVFLSVGVAMLVVALLASILPARRTARIDPIVALRSE